MKFENTEVTGFENAILGARLPMCKNLEEAKEKSDSDYICAGVTTKENGEFKVHQGNFHIGEKDLDLLKRLINADDKIGQPNSKFLRMIHAQVCITAPLYWWKEMDTYKVGTTANSTSTMHKLANTPITKECFEMDDFENMSPRMFKCKDEYGDTYEENNLCNFISLDLFWCHLIDVLNDYRVHYNETKDERYWKELIRLLPESWLQTRMFDCDYATLRNIYCWRKTHKLTEWHKFCEWVETLPYAKELIIN